MEPSCHAPGLLPRLSGAFHRRTLCIAALGFLLGTAGVTLVAPPRCYFAALALLAASTAAMWLSKRDFALLFCCAGAALVSAGLRYPPDGVYPLTASVVTLPDSPFFAQLQLVRAALLERIGLLFSAHGGVAKGMLLGERGDISPATLARFRDVGVLHLLAISGLHVSVLAGAVALPLRRGRWTRFLLVALFLLVYAALTAFSPSVVRAGIMFSCGALAFPLRMRHDPPSALSLAFVAVLLLNPGALFTAGFQLSFVAVYGLMLLTPVLQRPFMRLGRALSGLLAASLAVTVATLPTMAFFFGRVQLTSVLTNLFVLPLVPLFLVPAFCSVAISFLSLPLGAALARFAQFFLNVLVAFAGAGGALDVTIPAPGAAAYLLYLASLPILSPLCLLRKDHRFRLFLCCMGAALALWALFPA